MLESPNFEKYMGNCNTSKEISVFITIFNPFKQLGLKMSYYMQNKLAKKKMHQFCPRIIQPHALLLSTQTTA